MSANYKDLVNFQKKLESLNDSGKEQFMREATNELAGRLLRKVKKRTLPGVYPAETGKKGGTLKRNWKAMPIRKEGNNYIVEIENPTEYASYVEYGHRQEPGRYVPAIGKRLKKAWVPGKFMMTISEKELQTIAPKVLEAKLNKWLREALK